MLIKLCSVSYVTDILCLVNNMLIFKFGHSYWNETLVETRFVMIFGRIEQMLSVLCWWTVIYKPVECFSQVYWSLRRLPSSSWWIWRSQVWCCFFFPSNYPCQFPSGDFSFINNKISKYNNIWSFIFSQSCAASLCMLLRQYGRQQQ